ncbi:hypothetical protein ACH5RR_040522 [Cinchona calisaya]|uniref:Uncharacterized protein n=1 Tax=Cinchona calisaya TaxID=153742 RepID=A0ABD2XV09_9GENT
MSLNCLTWQGVKRTDSDVDIRERLCQEKPHINRFLAGFDRSWSGNLAPRPNNHDKMTRGTIQMVDKNTKAAHYRIHNSAPAGFEDTGSPRLARRCGMRRDWSFEDLRRVKGC